MTMLMKKSLREAQRILKQYSTAILVDAGGRLRELIPSAGRIVAARFKYGVGPVYYSLYRFGRIPRSEWDNYVTDDPRFKQFLMDINPERLRIIANNKLLFHEHCVKNGLPTIPVLGVVGRLPDLPGLTIEPLTTLPQWRHHMTKAPKSLFIKPIAGTYGEGAFTVERLGQNLAFNNGVGSLDDLFHYLQSGLPEHGGWIIQPRLRSHAALRDIVSPHGLATVRVVTQMRNGRAELLIADLKVTVGQCITDNFSKGTSGNLLAGIDVETGRITAAWGSTRRDWPVMTSFSRHPETGQPIEGFELPFWKDLVRVALRAQESLPELKSLGWDIAATTDGIVLVEANGTYDVSILQIAHQRGLKRELSQALGLQT